MHKHNNASKSLNYTFLFLLEESVHFNCKTAVANDWHQCHIWCSWKTGTTSLNRFGRILRRKRLGKRRHGTHCIPICGGADPLGSHCEHWVLVLATSAARWDNLVLSSPGYGTESGLLGTP